MSVEDAQHPARLEIGPPAEIDAYRRRHLVRRGGPWCGRREGVPQDPWLVGGPAGRDRPASAGYGLSAPTSATVAGGDLFVANQAGNSVSVVNASTGAHVATLSGSSFDLDQPTSITNVGPDVFVANGAGDSVTEFGAADRAPVRIIAGPQFQFSDPIALTADPTSSSCSAPPARSPASLRRPADFWASPPDLNTGSVHPRASPSRGAICS